MDIVTGLLQIGKLIECVFIFPVNSGHWHIHVEKAQGRR